MKEYQLHAKKNKKNKSLAIQLQGHLNVSNIAKLSNEITHELKDIKKVELNIFDVEDADLSFIQFIIAFRKKCSETDIDLTIDAALSPETTELIKRAGFTNIFN